MTSGEDTVMARAARTWIIQVRMLLATVVAAGLLVAGVGATTAAADTQMTATEAVNIRSAPSLDSAIIGGLYRGQTVTAVSSANGWTKVRFLGRAAYIASRYLVKGSTLPPPKAINAGTVKITTTDLNLRTGPGLSYLIIKVLREGTAVTMTGKTARGFAEVNAGGSRGWASLQYLASSANALPAVVGTRKALADLNIWVASTGSQVVAEVKKGSSVSITGAMQNGRAQIIFRNAIRWVTAKYLSNPDAAGPVTPHLPKIIGYRYATTALDIRSTNTDDYTKIDEVARGTRLGITGVVTNGRAQIVYSGAVRWVTAKYLSTTRPSVSTPAPSGSIYAVEKGLQPNAIKVHRAALMAFPQIKTYYGVRPDPYPDHPSGHALDLMLPGYPSDSAHALGLKVRDWARAHAKELGIQYVIFDQHIWNIERDAEGWRFMADRGSDSANHKNHVHITVYAKGYSPA
jgi:uncharacterized protein YgiM (DUF1202 family)